MTSGDDERALNIALRLRTGSVTTNGHSFFGITSPFGGTKQSGLGHRNGDEGYREYLNMKTIGARPEVPRGQRGRTHSRRLRTDYAAGEPPVRVSAS